MAMVSIGTTTNVALPMAIIATTASTTAPMGVVAVAIDHDIMPQLSSNHYCE